MVSSNKSFKINATIAEKINAFGDEIIVLINSSSTEGKFCLIQQLYSSKEWSPLHLHENENHYVVINEGIMEFEISGNVHICSKGEAIFMHCQEWHRFRKVSSEDVVMLIFNFPGGFDNMYREVAIADKEPNSEILHKEIIDKYRIRTKD